MHVLAYGLHVWLLGVTLNELHDSAGLESANEADRWLIKRAAVSQLWKSGCAPALLRKASAGRANVWKLHLLCFS